MHLFTKFRSQFVRGVSFIFQKFYLQQEGTETRDFYTWKIICNLKFVYDHNL